MLVGRVRVMGMVIIFQEYIPSSLFQLHMISESSSKYILLELAVIDFI